MDLKGKTAIVTGAAHRVGKGIAVELARKGCNIIVHYGRSDTAAKQTGKELEQLGVEAPLYSADLRDFDAIVTFIDEVKQNYEYQVIVNSAASFVKKKLVDTTEEDWHAALDINAKAPYFITKYSLDMLEQHEDSLVVNIGDLSSEYAWDSFSAHGISKAGLVHFTRIAAKELAPIRFNAILPGPILPPPDMNEDDPKWVEMIKSLPLKKSGTPQQIGHTVVFFAENDFITGSILPVDGGESIIGPKNH